MYIYLQRQSQFTLHSCLTVRIPSAGSALPCVSASAKYTQLAPATCVATPTEPRDPPSITGLPRQRDVVAVVVAPTVLFCISRYRSTFVTDWFLCAVYKCSYLLNYLLMMDGTYASPHILLGYGRRSIVADAIITKTDYCTADWRSSHQCVHNISHWQY